MFNPSRENVCSLKFIMVMSFFLWPFQDYHGYDLMPIPRNAWPSSDRIHLGKHSYTVEKGSAKIEVLLRQRAFFVRGAVEGKHVSWGRFATIQDAWIAACTKAGVLP